MNSRNNSELNELGKKIDALVGLFVSLHVDLDENEKIKKMNALGLDTETIGNVLGLTPNAVAIRMSRIRAKEKKKR